MTAPPPPVVRETPEQLVRRARALADRGRRTVLGIAGPPGAGKSTLCEALLAGLGDRAALVGMDGFHLANQELVRLGRRGRKGAPDTFDVDGYVALLRRLRVPAESTVYAPLFDRALEEPIGSAVRVPPHTPLVVTEGNYLLLGDCGWSAVRGCLDEAWYLDVARDVREQRLLRRRLGFGHGDEEAAEWVRRVDGRNGRTVEATRDAADLVVHLVVPEVVPEERPGPV